VFEDCASALLEVTKKDLQTMFEVKGGDYIKGELNKIDVAKALAESEKKLNDTRVKGAALDKLVRKVKYLRVLKERNLKAGDAYVLSVVPVTPPVMRSISVSKTGDLMPNDSNEFYKNLILNNQAFKDIKKEQGFDDAKRENRAALQQSVKELTGVVSPSSPHLKNRGAKGAIRFIAGDQPKYGYFQRKAIYSKMNLTGRATIAPDETLELDEVGLPEEMAWEMYTPFILRQLTQRGFTAKEAKDEVENRTAKAKEVLMKELDKRPVIVNRAPTLWKHSMVAAKPKLRSGKTLMMNTLWESSLGSDFDGDTMQIHLPITDEAIQESKNMFASSQVLSDKKRDQILMSPSQEPIVGLYEVTKNLGKFTGGAVKRYKTEAEAWDAYYKGTLKMTDTVEIRA
jgi:DNA-directed RNA polymerase subunit beta'